MGIVKRVKQYLSWDEYAALDKNNRVDPDTGEAVPAKDVMTGKEMPDPVPIAPPIGWFKQPSMFDHVRQMVRSEQLRMYAEAQGDESFEDANDFDVPDEDFPTSEYEDQSDFEPMPDLEARRQARFREQWFQERDAADYQEWKQKQGLAAAPPSDAPKSPPSQPPEPAGGGK